MRIAKPTAILLTLTLTATACAEQGGPVTREGVGTAAGAVAGGVLGSTIGGGAGKTVAIVGGALLGGLLGNVIGKSLDQESVTAYDLASQRALDSGQSQSWSNPRNGQYGTITPSPAYTDLGGGMPCREYNQTIYIDGQRYEGHGTACREADGVWRLMNQ